MTAVKYKPFRCLFQTLRLFDCSVRSFGRVRMAGPDIPKEDSIKVYFASVTRHLVDNLPEGERFVAKPDNPSFLFLH